MEAQAAGRIHPFKICVTAAAVVNPGCALTDFNAEEAAGSPLSVAGHPRRFRDVCGTSGLIADIAPDINL
jgi:hypothetical protein